MMKDINFPQFRKYNHGRTYFKILSPDKWEEIHILGGKYSLQRFQVKILPDRNFISDLTIDYEKHWLKIEEEEYEKVKGHCE